MINRRMMQSFKNGGFTLIEIVVGIGVIAVLIFALLNLYLAYGTLYNSQNTELTVLSEGRTVMSEFTLFTIQAYRVAGNFTFSTTTYYSGTSTVVLQIPAIANDGSIISNTWDYVVFYANGNNLYRQTQADGASNRISETKLLTSNLQGLSFTYDNIDFTQVQKVSIDLNLQKQDAKYTATNHLTQELILRNF